ncbi:MAG: hypothetical protein MEP57_01535 [Microvirga sp.]|nr:hypothetical protein [Microvirga sp.]
MMQAEIVRIDRSRSIIGVGTSRYQNVGGSHFAKRRRAKLELMRKLRDESLSSSEMSIFKENVVPGFVGSDHFIKEVV